jgi:hypothetical protein
MDFGCVDFVLPLKEIAKELRQLKLHPHALESMDREEVNELIETEPSATSRSAIWNCCPTSQNHRGGFQPVQTRHHSSARIAADDDPEAGYDWGIYKLLKEHPEESHRLYDDVLIPVTSFFRDPEVFEALKSKVYPAILKEKGNKGSIQMWAPGCSTGEETYSLAITLLVCLRHGRRQTSFKGSCRESLSIGLHHCGSSGERLGNLKPTGMIGHDCVARSTSVDWFRIVQSSWLGIAHDGPRGWIGQQT